MNETLFEYKKMNTIFKLKKIAPILFFPHATPNINDIRPIHHLGFQVERIQRPYYQFASLIKFQPILLFMNMYS